MEEYTYDNVIINPTQEDVESLIGKEVYFEAKPFLCLKAANEKLASNLGILVEVYKDSINPFCVKGKSGSYKYPCIIEKKEEPKPEYSEFESQEEFLNYYAYHRDKLVESSLNHQLSSFGGVWLKGKKPNVLYMVIEIWDEGVVLGDTKMRATNQWCGEYVKANTATEWKELCENYTFLDGSPCGKLKENK